MNPEKFSDIPSAEKHGNVYETHEREVGIVDYVFDDVVIRIDTTGKNYTDLPEVLFGTKHSETEKHSMDRPDSKSNSLDMNRVSECMKKVAHDTNQSTVWFYPHGKDGEDKERTEAARVKLFSRYFDIEPEKNGFGYVVHF
jgi:hypothetical protein